MPIRWRSGAYSERLAACCATLFFRENLPHCVDPAVLGLEIGSDQHFAEKSGAEHHQSGQQEKAARHHKRSVLQNDFMSQQLVDGKIRENDAADASPG